MGPYFLNSPRMWYVTIRAISGVNLNKIRSFHHTFSNCENLQTLKLWLKVWDTKFKIQKYYHRLNFLLMCKNWHFMPGLHSRLGYSSRLLARCEWDKVHTNVDIQTLTRESSITRQDILISFDCGLIYRHASESFKTRQEQVKSVEDETNVPFILPFSSCLDENVNQAV